jgi:hypothetical protein
MREDELMVGYKALKLRE